jgi:hypothetical protein
MKPRGQTRGATIILGAGRTTTARFGRQPPYGPRWKPGPQPPAALAELKLATMPAATTAAAIRYFILFSH